jgi:elongation factor P--(R)-beta-lysine ligase
MSSLIPSGTLDNLKQRAVIIQNIRHFFQQRNVLEVETPLLCTATVTDPYIESIQATANQQRLFLQTSPEYAMKRLIASGIGDCFQLCKAFRDDEQGHLHNNEFTMLEWYRLGFDHHQLMDEMDDLLQLVLNCPKASRLSYQQLFKKHLGINPHDTSITQLENIAKKHDAYDSIHQACNTIDDWLMLLLSELIEPKLGFDAPCMIHDYPKSQAALAKIAGGKAQRFEVYVNGIELANGFNELTNAQEQRTRFEKDLTTRKSLNKFMPPIDENFLVALKHGLPNCAGVALGVDRLVMIALGEKNIGRVTSI